MTLSAVLSGLRIPVICAPMYMVSDPTLAIACCRAGIAGSLPILNVPSSKAFEEWLQSVEEARTDAKHSGKPFGPVAVNIPARRPPLQDRYDSDLELLVRYEVPLVISMNGSPAEIVDVVHGYGGHVIHDVPSVELAHKAVDQGVDGLIALSGGAGGHTGTQNPFALMPQIRQFFDGPVALAGAIGDGRGIFAARALGADVAYMGTRFIATQEAQVPLVYKQMLLDHGSTDIVTSDSFTGLRANFMRGSIEAAGLKVEELLPAPEVFVGTVPPEIKAWRDVWSAGHGVGLIDDIPSIDDLVSRLEKEYRLASTA